VDSMKSIVRGAVKDMGLVDSHVDEIAKGLVDVFSVFKGFFWNNIQLTINFVINSKTIFFAHYPELIFSWMMSMDPNFQDLSK